LTKEKEVKTGIWEIDNKGIIDDDCIGNYLEFKDRESEALTNKYIEDMTQMYRDYKKISIYEQRS